jgi:hypothetical protein
MSSRTVAVPRTRRYEPAAVPAAPASKLLLAGAPVVAILGGMAAQWLDFRELRIPLLLTVGLGVLATAYAMSGTSTGWRGAFRTVLVGVATWAAIESLYAVIHVASGERFHADRFGAQPSQAIGLIAAHGLFLGAPTGLLAALLLRLGTARGRFGSGG